MINLPLHICNVKLFCLIVFCFVYCHVNAQTTTLLAYDTNGNRIQKQIVGSSPHPTVTASPEAVNANQPCTLVATDCPGTIQWLPGNQTGSQLIVTPTATTQYTAVCSVAGCTNSGFTKTTVTVIQCPTVQLTAASSVGSVQYGQPVSLYAFGCSGGTVNWSSGNIGSPITVPVYGASVVFTATCQTAYCPNLGSATVIVGGVSGCLTGDVIISKQIGNWNDPNTWACGRVPTANDEVFLNHTILVNGIVGYAKAIIKGEGNLILNNNGVVQLP